VRTRHLEFLLCGLHGIAPIRRRSCTHLGFPTRILLVDFVSCKIALDFVLFLLFTHSPRFLIIFLFGFLPTYESLHCTFPSAKKKKI
jgi:hypothetical protein